MEWTVAGNRPRIIIASKHSFSPSFLPSISPSFSSSFSSSAFSRSTPFFSRFSLSFFPPRFSSLYVRVSFRFVPLSTLSGSRPFYSTVDADDASVLSPKSKIPTETGEACTLEYFASLVFYEDDCETFNFWELLLLVSTMHDLTGRIILYICSVNLNSWYNQEQQNCVC